MTASSGARCCWPRWGLTDLPPLPHHHHHHDHHHHDHMHTYKQQSCCLLQATRDPTAHAYMLIAEAWHMHAGTHLHTLTRPSLTALTQTAEEMVKRGMSVTGKRKRDRA